MAKLQTLEASTAEHRCCSNQTIQEQAGLPRESPHPPSPRISSSGGSATPELTAHFAKLSTMRLVPKGMATNGKSCALWKLGLQTSLVTHATSFTIFIGQRFADCPIQLRANTSPL